MNATAQWWLLRHDPETLLWALLRDAPEGRADVLDASGLTRRFDDDDAARHFLLDSGYVALDGLDEDDAQALGCTLDELEPPDGDDDAELVPQMTQYLPHRDERSA